MPDPTLQTNEPRKGLTHSHDHAELLPERQKPATINVTLFVTPDQVSVHQTGSGTDYVTLELGDLNVRVDVMAPLEQLLAIIQTAIDGLRRVADERTAAGR